MSGRATGQEEKRSETGGVSIVDTPSYGEACLKSAVDRHFALLGLDRLIRPGMRILLKPNLLMKRKPEEGTTTHPGLVRAAADKAIALGAGEVVIADSPGGRYTPELLRDIYEAAGMARAARESGARLNLDTGYRPAENPEGKVCREWNIINPVLEADLVINLPKLKTHCMAALSGAVKNLFGCVPGLQKPELHFRFPRPEHFFGMMTDLAELVKPGITIVDAVESMEGDGPSSGSLRHTGLTLAGSDPYGLDLALCHLTGMEPERVPTVRESIARGLCPGTAEQLRLTGDVHRFLPFEAFRRPSSRSLDFTEKLPGWLRGPARWVEQNWLAPYPAVRAGDCIGCGRCAQSCPAHVIAVRKGKAVIDRAGCIRCYCCHEMCPVRAIGIRRRRLFTSL